MISSLSTDDRLTLMYKTMFGVNNIDNTSGNTTFQGNTNVALHLDVFKNGLFVNNTTISSSLYVSYNSYLQNDSTINSSLFISGNTILFNDSTIGSNLNINGNTIVNNNLNVNGNSILNNSVTVLSSLNISGNAVFNNNIITNNLSSINNYININSNTINIGSPSSKIQMIGSSLTIATNELDLSDRVLLLNINSDDIAPFDNGGSSGIEIIGQQGNGFIQTTPDGLKFQIKAPLDSNINYINTTQSSDESFSISGNATLYQSSTFCSNIYVSSYTTFEGNTLILSEFNVSGNSLLQGSSTVNGSLFVSGNTLLLGSTTFNSSLFINNTTNINGSTTIDSTLLISGNTNIGGQITILSFLNTAGNAIVYGNITVNSFLNVSGSTIFNGQTSILSSINIKDDTNIMQNSNIFGSINISGNTIINNTTTINSSLVVSGTTSLFGNITLGSNFSVYGNIINKMPEYQTNSQAKAGGIPLWGLYRTGGIVKICLDDVPPTINLSGPSTVSISLGNSYNDQGVIALDYENNILPVYMTYLGTGSTNIISSSILVTGTSTLVTGTSVLSYGNYTITYSATDNIGNIGNNYRNIIVFNPVPQPVYIFSGGTISSNYWCVTDKTQGQAWTGNDISRSVFIPSNYDWSKGLSLSFQINFSQFYHGLFSFRANHNTGSRGLYHLHNQDSSYIGNDINLVETRGLDLTGNNSFLFSFPNDGSFTVWKNGSIVYTAPTTANVLTTTTVGSDVFFGVSQIATNYLLSATLNNIKIWNQPMVWQNYLFTY
jgi:UDP-3-O-[3-hydroxymyristoyl] glucosamine N-acyltransferase